MKKTMKAAVIILLAAAFFSCHEEDEEKIYIDKIEFNVREAKMGVGQEMSVQLVKSPQGAGSNEKITYTMSQEGYVELKNGTNSGVVMKAKMPGSAVLIAKGEKVSGYLEVRVEGGNYIEQPYIMASEPVMEIKEGEQKVISVNLYGGSVLDNNGFEFSLEEGKENISMVTTANTAVIKGLKSGNQKIRITHPRAEYDTEVLIFVNKSNEYVKYIYCEKNVIMLETAGQYKNLEMSLHGGSASDNKDFKFEVTEGNKNIEIIPNNEIINMRALMPGMAKIKVTHPYAEMPFEITAICVSGDVPLITVDKTFIIMEMGRNEIIKAGVENPTDVLALSQFSFEYGENSQSVINVTQTNNEFFVQAVRNGLAKVIIKNSQAQYSREVLIFVRSGADYKDDYYITTSQNVIQTQVGDDVIYLTMLLVGGNTADANSFEWEVSDGTVIEVESGNGRVKYGIYERTAAVSEAYVATALITPKRIGVSTVTVRHPKSEVTANVLVKVYPKNTFAGTPVIVKTEGLIKVLRGGNKEIELEMASGNRGEVGSINWSVENNEIAAVAENTHLTVNMISGISSGRTKLKISGGNLRQDHESIVLVGTAEELAMAQIIYVDTIYQTMAEQQVVRIEVKNSQNEKLNGFKIRVADTKKLYAVMVENEAVLQGKEPGETDVVITHEKGQEEGITLHVTVLPAGLSIDKPYYITGPEIIGLVNGGMTPVSVSLVGAPAHVKGDIKWNVMESGVMDIVANGEMAELTGRSIGRQTKITVSHPKSENVKTIIVYTVATEQDLNNKVVIGTDKNNYLMVRGEELFLVLKTNAKDADKADINWGSSDISVIVIDDNKDSAMIKAAGVGNAKVTISHPNNILPSVIYFSVVEARADEKMISGPATIELLIGESRIISLSTRNLGNTEKENIHWDIENKDVANLQENGESAYMLGLERGVTYVDIAQNQLGYRHRATLLCARTREELASMYIMGVSSSYVRMGVGEEKKIKLEYGSNGFPESEKVKIKWTASDDGSVKVAGDGRGESATIVAQAEGLGYVDIYSEAAENKTLRINFEISGKGAANRYFEFKGFDKIKGMVIGRTEIITVKIFEGESEITSGYSLMKQVENEKENVCTVSQADNILTITAVGAGQSVITADHPQVMEKARILIYTAATEKELEAMYPIAAEKKNYLLQVGERAEVRLTTDTAKDLQNMEKITWGMSNTGIVGNPVFSGKKVAVFEAKKAGSVEILIGYPNSNTVVERVYISVVEKTANVDFSKNIYTENIIGLYRGQEKNTSLMLKGFTLEEEADIRWESSNASIAEIAGSDRGRSVTIRAKETAPINGETYITVSYGTWIKRHILVYVCEEKEIKNYKAMNMENQYVRIGRNETVILPVYFAAVKTQNATEWEDDYKNGVVTYEVKENGSKIEVTGKEEGVAVIEAANAGKTNPATKIRLYVEVSNNYINLQKDNEEKKYITAGKTVYLLNPNETGKTVEVNVSAIGMAPEEISEIKWAQNNDKIRIFPAGNKCVIMVNAQGGETVLKASHPAANYVEIKVIISSEAATEGISYVNFEDVVRLGYGETKNLNVHVAGVTGYNPNYFSVKSDNEKVEAGVTGNVITLKGKTQGQAKIRIEHPDAQVYKEAIVVVTATADGLIYLTTEDNFNVLKKGERKRIEVELVGYDDQVTGHYKWELGEGGEGIITVTGNGKTATVEALGDKIGQTAKITVTHDYAKEFPLFIYVKVSMADIKPVYITTEKNIVSITEGNSLNISAELVNGDASEYSKFSWTTQDGDIIALYASGNTALVQGKSPGAARIKVSNPSCLNSIDIIAIIEPDRTSSGIYIATENFLVEMKPNEPVRTLDVRLVGGNPEDVYGFKWEIGRQESLERYNDGTSKTVVDMTAAADRAYLSAKNEGEAVITVTHPKTQYKLDIKADVKYNKKIEFKQRTVNVAMGDTVMVDVDAPTNQKVIYESQDESKAVVSGTNKMCIIEGIRNGPVIVMARNIKGDLSDEIIVQVTYVNQDYGGTIKTQGNYVTLNKNETAGVEVKAALAGKDKNGNELKESDEDSIEWHVQGNDPCVSFSKKKDGNEKIGIGGGLSIKPIKAGEAEIHLKHAKLKDGYIKRFYVKVEVSEAVFYLDKTVSVLGKKKTDSVYCNISNVLTVDWENDVEWKVLDNDMAFIVSKIDGGRGIIFQTKEKAGNTQIEAVYKGAVTRKMNIIVEDAKILEIAAGVNIYRKEIKDLYYTVNPADENIFYSLDNGSYVNVKEVNKAGKYIRLEGLEEGQTILTVKTETTGLMRKVIINTVNSRNFKYVNSENVRMRPGTESTVYYEIEDALKEYVDLDRETMKNSSNDIIKFDQNVNVTLDKNNKKIIIKSKEGGEDGYFSLALKETITNEYLRPVKEVYIYYEKINIGFRLEREANSGANIKTLHSRMDGSQNAVYLADGESVNLILDIAGEYGGNTLELIQDSLKTKIELDQSVSGSEYAEFAYCYANKKDIKIICGKNSPPAGLGAETLKSQKYIGRLIISYKYFNGEKEKKEFQQTMLLYGEIWNRKN